VSGDQRDDWVARYRDGELGALGHWRARRRLNRDAAARAEQARLDALGGMLRELDGAGATPDLWPSIRAALDAAPASPAPDGGLASRLAWPGFHLRWIGAGLAAAAAGVALAIGLSSGDASEPGAIRWLDARGRPLLVLQDDAEATIIWVPEPSLDEGSAEGLRVAV
jgi:hypothetical protein